MTFRFQRRVKILPGLSLNFTKRGLSSATVGERGAHLTIGKTADRVTIGIPGTGLSWWQRFKRNA